MAESSSAMAESSSATAARDPCLKEPMGLSIRTMSTLNTLDSRSFGFLSFHMDPSSSLKKKSSHVSEASFVTRELIQQGIEQVRRDLGRLVGDQERLVACYQQLGHLYLLVEDYHNALEAYENYHNLAPSESVNNANYLYGIALIYFHTDCNWQWIIDAFMMVLKLCPQFARIGEVYLKMAIIYKKLGMYLTNSGNGGPISDATVMVEIVAHYNSSMYYFKLALQVSGQLSLNKCEIHYHIGHLFCLQKNYCEARITFENILRSKALPNDVREKSLRQLAWMKCNIKEEDSQSMSANAQATELLKLAVGTNPQSYRSWYLLGRCHDKENNVGDAFVAYQQALSQCSSSEGQSNIYCSIGLLYQKILQPKDSLQAYLCAVHLEPHNITGWINLGCLYEAAAQPIDALACYKNAKASPKFTSAGDGDFVTSRLSHLEQTAPTLCPAEMLQPQALPSLAQACSSLTLPQLSQGVQSKQVMNSISPYPLTNVPSWKPPLQPQVPTNVPGPGTTYQRSSLARRYRPRSNKPIIINNMSTGWTNHEINSVPPTAPPPLPQAVNPLFDNGLHVPSSPVTLMAECTGQPFFPNHQAESRMMGHHGAGYETPHQTSYMPGNCTPKLSHIPEDSPNFRFPFSSNYNMTGPPSVQTTPTTALPISPSDHLTFQYGESSRYCSVQTFKSCPGPDPGPVPGPNSSPCSVPCSGMDPSLDPGSVPDPGSVTNPGSVPLPCSVPVPVLGPSSVPGPSSGPGSVLDPGLVPGSVSGPCVTAGLEVQSEFPLRTVHPPEVLEAPVHKICRVPQNLTITTALPSRKRPATTVSSSQSKRFGLSVGDSPLLQEDCLRPEQVAALSESVQIKHRVDMLILPARSAVVVDASAASHHSPCSSYSPSTLSSSAEEEPSLYSMVAETVSNIASLEGFVKDFNTDSPCSGRDLENFLASDSPDTSPDACQDATHKTMASGYKTNSSLTSNETAFPNMETNSSSFNNETSSCVNETSSSNNETTLSPGTGKKNNFSITSVKETSSSATSSITTSFSCKDVSINLTHISVKSSGLISGEETGSRGKETKSKCQKTSTKGKKTGFKVKNTGTSMTSDRGTGLTLAPDKETKQNKECGMIKKKDSGKKRKREEMEEEEEKEDPVKRIRQLFTSPVGFCSGNRDARASRAASVPVIRTANIIDVPPNPVSCPSTPCAKNMEVGSVKDAAAHSMTNGLLGAPPSPPPATEGMELHPQVPIFEVDASQEDYEKELKEFCFDDGRPVVLLRNLCREVNLDLCWFSSASLNNCAPHHTIDIREQVQQEADENTDSSGRRQVWRCESGSSNSSIMEYCRYQVSQLSQPSLTVTKPSSSGKDKCHKAQRRSIRFGTNVDLSDQNKWKDQLQELEKLPQFLRVASPESDFLAHVGHTILGMNSVQLYMKVAGCRTPGHQENNNFCSININIGPGDCEWFAVDNQYWGVFHQLCKKRRLSFLTGSWWPSLRDLESRNIPVYRFTQKMGEVVWLNPGTVHWVQANSVCNNIAWNVGPITSHQFRMCWERYLWNKTQKVPSIVPVVHLAWNLVKSVKITDKELWKQLKVILEGSYYQTRLILKRCRESDVPVLKHDKLNGEPSPTCRQCSEEVFNLLFVVRSSQAYEVYCHKCASVHKNFTVLQQFDLKDLECTYLNFLQSGNSF